MSEKQMDVPSTGIKSSDRMSSYLQKNPKMILGTLIALIAVCGALFAFKSSREKKQMEAANAIHVQLKLLDAAVAKSDKKSADWVSPLQKEMNDVDSSAKAHANTESAFEAWVKLGDIYNENAMYEKAEGYYLQALGATSVESKKTAAKYSLAFTYENQKKHDKAISSLNDVLSSTFKAVHEDATLALARNYEKMGKADKAKELYAQFKVKFPNSPSLKMVEALEAKNK